MGWFQINGTGGGINGGGGQTGGNGNQIEYPTTPNGKVQLKDADGKIVKSVQLDARGKGTYTRTLSKDLIGQQKLTAHYTGDASFKAKSEDEFVAQVTDTDGTGGSTALLPTVDQIVAGPGIYISAANGQGIVTIATEPLLTEAGTEDLYDITWSTQVTAKPWGAVGQFTAVGANGVNLRSRDGRNWVQMRSGTDTAIFGVSSELGTNIEDGHVEYVGVGPQGTGFYGRLGSPDGDGMVTTGQLQDQDGPITDTLITTRIIYNGGTQIPNSQFTGGITDFAVTLNGGSTSTGAVYYDDYNRVITHWKISDVSLQKGLGLGLGKPSLIYSAGGAEVVKVKTFLYVEDIRFLPGTAISGQYPYYSIDVNP